MQCCLPYCRDDAEYPVTYATCGTIKALECLPLQKKQRRAAHILNVVEWLRDTELSDRITLAHVNEQLVVELIALTRGQKGISLLSFDQYVEATGGLEETRAPGVHWRQQLHRRHILTADRARRSYAWASSYLSYKTANCLLCGCGRGDEPRAYRCCDLNARPDLLDVVPDSDFTWVRPEDTVKAAFYHNLLTLYAIAFFLCQERPVLDLIKTWENKLFA
jgi:hypothetical protein